MQHQIRKIFILLAVTGLYLVPIFVMAQGVTVTSQGVGGDRDKKKRDPVVSVTRIVGTENVKLLVDAHVQSYDFRKYPIRFEFYVNRHLFSTQIRSPQLSGPIGVEIGPDIASPPFNYSVVARIMHPNRTFTTVIEGAAYANEYVSQLDCTVTLGSDRSAKIFVANNIDTVQQGNNSFSLAFEAEDESEEEKISVTAVVVTEGSNASSSLGITRNDILTVTPVTGTVTANDSGVGVKSMQLASEDASTTLSCS